MSIKFGSIAVLIGMLSGLMGVFLILLLNGIEHGAYGYPFHSVWSAQGFLQAVTSASSERKVIVLMVCGLVAGVGWWLIFRYGKPLVAVDEIAHAPHPYLPPQSTIAHSLLQIITIALGSPLGREVAPRELSALLAIWIAAKFKCSIREIQMLLACAAGAGLGAVYNAPLGGALFSLEVLLRVWNPRTIFWAFLMSILASTVVWLMVGTRFEFVLPVLKLNGGLLVWSGLSGIIFGVAAYGFQWLTMRAKQKAPRSSIIILTCLLNFTLIGGIAIIFPELLGNGKGVVEFAFSKEVSFSLALILFALRYFMVWSSFRAGAKGGLLSPSIANGALLAIVLGHLGYFVGLEEAQEAYMVVGATAFLAAAQNMPLTAIVMIFELTHVNILFIVPFGLAVSSAMLMRSVCMKKFGG